MTSWQNSTEKTGRLKMWFHRQNMAPKDWSFVFITQPDSFSSRHENLCSVIMNTCLHCAKKWHRNLSDMWWPSTFEIELQEITTLMCEQKLYPIRLHVNGRNNSQHCWPTMLGVVASVCTHGAYGFRNLPSPFPGQELSGIACIRMCMHVYE